MVQVQTPISTFDHTLQISHQWIQDVQRSGDFADEAQAFTAMRAVLHVLRDRITTDEAADLSAQLPILIRGVYFEGWRPSETPTKERDLDAFLQHVREELSTNDLDPQNAVRATFKMLRERATAGEVQHVKEMMPKEVQSLWPE